MARLYKITLDGGGNPPTATPMHTTVIMPIARLTEKCSRLVSQVPLVQTEPQPLVNKTIALHSCQEGGGNLPTAPTTHTTVIVPLVPLTEKCSRLVSPNTFSS